MGFAITETAAIDNLEAASVLIRRLRGLGCHVAPHDFGSGLSSFSHLGGLDVNLVKIDGGLVSKLPDDPVSRAVVEAIVGVARVLDIRTLGTCVESAEQKDWLRKLGVDYAQGCGICPPQPWDY